MNALRTMRRLLELVLIGGLAIAVVVQHREITRLRGQRPEATDEVEQSPPATEPDLQPGSAATSGQAQSQSPQDTQKDRSELLRLRNEVTRLRAQEAELAKVRQENTNLKTYAQNLQSRFPRTTGPESGSELAQPAPPLNAWVGIQITAAPNNSAAAGRVVISGIMDNSPAAEAKLQDGDVVLAVNGESITNLLQLRTITGSSTVGQPLVFDLLRDNNSERITVLPQAPPEEFRPRPARSQFE